MRPQTSGGRPPGTIAVAATWAAIVLLMWLLGGVAGMPAQAFWIGVWMAGFVLLIYGLILLSRPDWRRWGTGLVIGSCIAGLVSLTAFGATSPDAPAAAEPVPSPAASQSAAPPPRAASGSPTPRQVNSTTSPGASSQTSSTPAPSRVATPTAQHRDPSTASELVTLLLVRGRGPKTGYDRDLFGWNSYDFDRNGCDQRNDILSRDMTKTKIKAGSGGCRVMSGVLQDRYSATAYPLDRDQVDIDHVVSLSNAWQMGAAQWSTDKRLRLANDPLNLVATTQTLNRQKGDGDAATWLPPARSARCSYVARQAAVKSHYGLSVTTAERAAMQRVLVDCPRQPVPAATQRPPTASQTASPQPSARRTQPSHPPAAPEPPVTDPRFDTCAAAKRAGYGPYIYGKDPEYDWYRDQDGDGVVCE